MGHDEAIIFEKTYGVLTPELRQMCQDMVEHGVTEAAMESTAVYWVPVWNELCNSMELKLVNPYFLARDSSGSVSLRASTATLALNAAVNFDCLAISIFFVFTNITISCHTAIFVPV